MSIEDGGPAFPGPDQGETNINIHEGMSLRDWFAGQALAGMLAYPGDESLGSCHNNSTPVNVALNAYYYADAMLQARKEKPLDPTN